MARELKVVISGDSASFEKAMARAQRSADKTATGLEATGRRMQATGASITRTGKSLTRGITLPIAAAAAGSAKLAIDFEKSMRNVNSIAGLPEKQFQKLNNQVLSLAGPVAQAPLTLSEGMYDLVSSGFAANKSVGILKVAAEAATAGLTTTEVSVKAVAAALNAYHRPAKEAGAISDDLFETVNRGVVSFDELASSIGYVLPAASTLGITTKEVGASISTLTKEGQSGETAITNLNQTITAFIKPSKAMTETLDKLGYASGEQLIKQKGFQGALEAVTKTAHGSKEAVGEMFGNVRAMRGVFGLTGESAKSAREDLKAFNDDTGATAKVFKEQSKSLAFQWNKLKAEGEVLGINLGNKLVPVLRKMVGHVRDAVHWFEGLSPATQKTIGKIAAFAAAAGPAVWIVGKLTTGIGGLLRVASGIGTFGKGVGNFAKGLYGFGSTLTTALKAGQGISGSFMIAGESAAPSFMKGMRTALPAAVAAAGLGSIIYSAAKGDWRSAGLKAGGALIGGISGYIVGGPVGAGVGIGIGSVAGQILSGIFGSGGEQKKYVNYFHRAETALSSLGSTSKEIKALHSEEKTASEEAKDAEQKLSHVREKFGPHSRQAIEAEGELIQKRRHIKKLNREIEEQERKRKGPEMRAAMITLKHSVPGLASEQENLVGKRQEQRWQLGNVLANYKNGLAPYSLVQKKEHELAETTGELEKKTKQLGTVYGEAEKKIGPNFVKKLKEIAERTRETTRAQSETGQWFDTKIKAPKIADAVSGELAKTKKLTRKDMGSLIGTINQFPKATQGSVATTVSQMLREWAQGHPKLEHQVDRITEGLRKNFAVSGNAAAASQRKSMQHIIEATSGASGAVAQAMSSIGGNLTAALKALGAHNIPEFKINFEAMQHHHDLYGKQRGGPINIGAPTGDTVPAMLERGEYVLNRKATAAIGTSTLDSINFGMAPRFQKGGALCGEPQISGPEPFRSGDQHAVHQVYKAAVRYYNRHNGIGRIIANGNRMSALHQPYLWGGGHGASPSRNGPWDCSGGISELLAGAGLSGPSFNFAPMVSGGFESWGLPGKGDVSVLANTDHVYAVVKGKGAIGTSSENPGGGFGWISGYTFRPGFTIRHADFGGSGGRSSGKRGRGQSQKKGFQKGGKVGQSAVEAAASKYHVPLWIEWGIAGAESTWGKGGSNLFGLLAAAQGVDVSSWTAASMQSAKTMAGLKEEQGSWAAAMEAYSGGDYGLAHVKALWNSNPLTGTGKAPKIAIPKGTTAHGGTSAGGATAKEIKAATKLGAKHAANPKVTRNVPTSTVPEWGKSLPWYQREELENRGTTQPERETILGNAETNASFAEGIAAKNYERAKTAFEADPTEANWHKMEAAAANVQERREGQAAASTARKLFEKGVIDHATKGIKQINWKLAHAAGKLSKKEVKALKEKRAELVANRAGAREGAQGATESLRGYEEERAAEEAERKELLETQRKERRQQGGELALAQAETTKGTKADDLKALEGLKKIAEEELTEARQSGNLGDIAEATRNLTQATENLKNLAVEAFEEQTEGELALAELTESMADDIAILHNKLTFAEERLNEAEAEGNWSAIATWAHEVKGLTETIKSDEGAESSAQLAEAIKSLEETIEQQTKFAEAATSTSSATAWKALADILSGNLGPRTIASSKTAGTGNIGTASRL